jgi:AcrR family transcriptional regulator
MDADFLRRGRGRRVGKTVTKQSFPPKLAPRPTLLAGEDLLPEPQQKRSVAKRERLKLAALALFGEKGYEGTSVDEIADRADLAMGSFYQHYRSKRQLLVALMDELLDHLSRLELRPKGSGDIRVGLRELLSRAFSTDLRYLGAYRAWQEAAFSDPELAQKQQEIHAWTTARVTAVFSFLQQLPGARSGVDIAPLARVMDSFFWNLLAQALRLSKAELDQWIDAATHLIYHALFTDETLTLRPQIRT